MNNNKSSKKNVSSKMKKVPRKKSGKNEKTSFIGVAEKTPRRPKPTFKASPGAKDSIITTGSDYISQVKVPTGADLPGGSILYSIPLAPDRVNNTRLSLYSKMFEKYQILDMKFHFNTACPTTAAGTYVHFVDRDGSDTPLAGEALIRHAYSVTSNTARSWWESSSVLYRPEDPQRFYYTSSTGATGVDPRLSTPGVYYFACSTDLQDPAVSGSPTTRGEVWVEYKIHWYDPTIETPIEAAQSSVGSGAGSVTLTQGNYLSFNTGIAPVVSGGVEFSSDRAQQGNHFHIPGGTVVNIVEALSGLNTAAPSTGIVDQLFVKPEITGSGNASNVLLPISVLPTELTSGVPAVGLTTNALQTWLGINFPNLITGDLVQQFFPGLNAQGMYVDTWQLFGTLVAGYTTAANRMFTVGPAYNSGRY